MSRDNLVKAIIWSIPIIFGAGGFYAFITSNTISLTNDVAEVQIGLSEHKELKAHPVTEERIDTILTEQRAVRAEQKEQGENIAAICAATGARCK